MDAVTVTAVLINNSIYKVLIPTYTHRNTQLYTYLCRERVEEETITVHFVSHLAVTFSKTGSDQMF